MTAPVSSNSYKTCSTNRQSDQRSACVERTWPPRRTLPDVDALAPQQCSQRYAIVEWTSPPRRPLPNFDVLAPPQSGQRSRPRGTDSATTTNSPMVCDDQTTMHGHASQSFHSVSVNQVSLSQLTIAVRNKADEATRDDGAEGTFIANDKRTALHKS